MPGERKSPILAPQLSSKLPSRRSPHARFQETLQLQKEPVPEALLRLLCRSTALLLLLVRGLHELVGLHRPRRGEARADQGQGPNGGGGKEMFICRGLIPCSSQTN